MSLAVESVRKLNERIEALNLKKTKLDTQREMLENNFHELVAEYEKSFGVKLQGKDLASTVKKILSEKKKVEGRLLEEFELKEKVVEALESGNIERANGLLGIVTDGEDEPEEEPEEPEEEPVEEAVEDPVKEAIEEPEEPVEVEDDFGLEGVDDIELDDIEDVEEVGGGINDFRKAVQKASGGASKEVSTEDAFSVFDGLEDDDVPKTKKAKGATKKAPANVGSTVEDTVEELDAVGIDLPDVEDDDDDDFGFGNLLAGTKLGK